MPDPSSRTLKSLARIIHDQRWRICCLGVAALTYLAVFCALRLPENLVSFNFFFTAFSAAMIQFLLIDFARHGFQRRAPRSGKDPFTGDFVITRVIRDPSGPSIESAQPRITRVQRPQSSQRMRSPEKLGLN